MAAAAQVASEAAAGADAPRAASCGLPGAAADAAARGSCTPSAEAAEDAASAPSTELGSDCASECGDDVCDESCRPVPPESTMLIFDWDDTVLPSTWIHEQGLSLADDSWPTAEQQGLLDRLADRAAHTLGVAKQYGVVTLVTNAEAGWIELSCQKFMPSLWPSLVDVKLFSARSTYECQGVASPFE
ncbi:unnamed protein product, partial [Prorocentrum cordatum]